MPGRHIHFNGIICIKMLSSRSEGSPKVHQIVLDPPPHIALAQINISVFENRYISDLFKLIIYLVKPDLIYMLSGFKSTHTERGAAVSNVQCIDHFDQRVSSRLHGFDETAFGISVTV